MLDDPGEPTTCHRCAAPCTGGRYAVEKCAPTPEDQRLFGRLPLCDACADHIDGLYRALVARRSPGERPWLRRSRKVVLSAVGW